MRETLPHARAQRDLDGSMRPGAAARERIMRGLALGPAVVASAICVTTVVATARSEPSSIAPLGSWLSVGGPGIGLAAIALVVAAILAMRKARPRASIGLSIATVATLVPLWSAWRWLGADLRAAAVSLIPATVVGLLVVVTGWHGVSRGNATHRAVAAALSAGAVLVHLLGYDPFADPGCRRTCEHVSPLLAGVVSTRSAVALMSALTALAAIVAVVGIFRSPARRAPRVVVATTVVALAEIGTAAAVRSASWGGEAWNGVLIVHAMLLGLVAAAVCLVEFRSRRTRAAVHRVVTGLSPGPGGPVTIGGGIRDVHFAVPGTGRWVDAAGRDVEAGERGSKHVVLRQDAEPVLRLVLTRGADEGDVVEALSPAGRLALRNAQLSALAMARLSEVRESQRRVVAATDAERKRIERDLHDAAQQRLIGVSFQLSIARSRAGSAAASLERADRRVRDALGRLRDLAHGIFPRVLADEGLEAAVDDLIAGSPHPVTLETRIDGEVDSEAAMAAYATVAAALRHASVGGGGHRRIDVTLESTDHDLAVTLRILGSGADPPDLTEVADRVGAAGGRLTNSTGPDAVAISAVIPTSRTAPSGAP